MSSGSESDEEYVPGEPEQLSEEESANEETEQQYENEVAERAMKRKVVQVKKVKKKLKTRSGVKEIVVEETIETLEDVKDPAEEKNKEEDLWAKFLEGTDTKPKPAIKDTNNKKEGNLINEIVKNVSKDSEKQKDDKKSKAVEIFEFAGEKIVVENNVIKEKISTDSPIPNDKVAPTTSRKAPGLSNILSKLGKKGKLTTLEKSKLDWTTYKKVEGIEDEIQSHNKGKDGYLDRRDFLERADLRQYELERDLRMNRRSNR